MLQAAAKIFDLQQHIRQLQQEANNAGALEYRCEGLQQEKQQLMQQLQQLRGMLLSSVCMLGNDLLGLGLGSSLRPHGLSTALAKQST